MKTLAIIIICLSLSTSGIVAFAQSDDCSANILQDYSCTEINSSLRLISSYSTSFVTSSENRAYNVNLASQSFYWRTIEPMQELSFNEVVGRRSEERGYKISNVILDGEYIQGVGGGVCQVSSTLYNAWIRAGLEVKYAQPHSLPTSYCALGQDATVSDYIDLKLINNTNCGVVINATIKESILTFNIYGMQNDYTIEIYSKLINTLNPPPPIVTYVENLDGYDTIYEDGEGNYAIISNARTGYEVEVWRKLFKDGLMMEDKKIRRAVYLPSPAKIAMVKNT